MIEVKTEWNKENLKKYIMYKTFFENKYTMLSVIVFLICFIAIIGVCAAMYFIIQMPFFLIMAGAVILLTAGFAVLFFYKINKNIKASLKENKDTEENAQESTVLTEDSITIIKNGFPYGEMRWDKVASISFNDKGGAAYLSTDEGAVLILEYKNIIKGSERELKEMLQIKNVKLSNKA